MFKRKLKQISAMSVLLALILIFPSGKISAQTAADLQNKISDSNAQISQLEATIASYQKQLDDLGTQKSSLSNSLKQLTLTGQELAANIKVTQSKIDATNLDINQLSLDIGDKQGKINTDTQAIAEELRQTDELDTKSILEALLSENNFSDMWNEYESLRSVQSNLATQAGNLKSAKVDLESSKTEAEAAKEQLVALQGQLNDQKKINDQNTAAKSQLLKDTKDQESNYNKLLASELTKKQAFEADVRNYESQLKFVLDPNSLPKAGSSVLSWPLDHIYITQLFGATVDAKRLYTSGSHSGVDFAASVGTPVKSVASGVVMGTGNTDIACPKASYGQWVLIKHNNGLATIYGHLSLIKVTTGQNIADGQLIGYSGNTGYTTGPHLHLGVFVGDAVQVKNLPSAACSGRIYTMPVAPTNAYLDPMLYLPPYSG